MIHVLVEVVLTLVGRFTVLIRVPRGRLCTGPELQLRSRYQHYTQRSSLSHRFFTLELPGRAKRFARSEVP